MGPRSNERGKDTGAIHHCPFKPTLQWGRAPMSAERPEAARHIYRRGKASMGPRSNERGKTAIFARGGWWVLASMGPRSNERGKLRDSVDVAVHGWLQWGRAPMSAESPVHPVLRRHLDHWASMGPRSNERGKSVAATANSVVLPGFNGAALQ